MNRRGKEEEGEGQGEGENTHKGDRVGREGGRGLGWPRSIMCHAWQWQVML